MDDQKNENTDPEVGKLIEPKASAPVKDSAAYAESKKGSGGKALSSCLLYTFCSVSMVLVNKSLASSYNHLITTGNLNFLLVVFQAVIAVIAVEFSKKMGWVDYPPFDMKIARQWAPVNITFCAMLFTGMASLQYNSVPMVTIFKNITNIVVSMGDYYFFGTKVEAMVVVAFSVMLGGAVFAAKNDMTVTVVGLFWMIANCLATAGYILYMKFATKTVKLSKFGMVFYNNVLCTVFLLPVTLYNGEMKVFLSTDAIHTFDYAWKNAFAGFVGFFLNFASLNCVSNTGPTTYAIVGSLNKVPVALLGWFLFAAKITPQTWFFIAVSMSGGFLYSYAKIAAGKKKTKARSG
mmetsp:Transcript_15957/g.23976  ORF Transcript_15957/g.23976 Transcript_15957/m.23976 type:complete len:349 (+) Transcript_15957:89-1135(+)|eukprot:CAMPEP_0203672666 /NCGR_PEP_ID=MMETSP0090-20130426/8650_1 /ASSEMBLY_ACC=CAM_ASM_001088 /TAXON_ID=426623 /ORGANISM="Chaetoceros affinis, Strain CCMP159" /LENGTH=348 /DNA_ID=CAMNT_0050538019 /DNA_START=29 /DNA_END=1075 /DNA_ORIENTATION=-